MPGNLGEDFGLPMRMERLHEEGGALMFTIAEF